MNQKGFANIILVAVVAVVAIAGTVRYFALRKPSSTVHEQPPVVHNYITPIHNPNPTRPPTEPPTPIPVPKPAPKPNPTSAPCYRCDIGVYDSAKPPKAITLTGDIQNTHDPMIIEVNGTFYSFSTDLGTSNGLMVKTSPDLLNWKSAGQLFDGTPPRPDWLQQKVPGVGGLWAPDVSYFGGAYHIYYAVAKMGSIRACIGHLSSPDFNFDNFVDRGPVVCSNVDSTDDWFAIDPNVIVDENSKPWLAFGSFLSGIKMIELDQSGARANDQMYSLAARSRHENDGAIEAPFIVRRGNYYYLFTSWESCCQGVNSKYNIRVGRSKTVIGPYVDKSNKPLMEGGGTLVLQGSGRWRGPGHNAILLVGKKAYNVYHSYDANNNGMPTLRISELVWDTDGWPISGGP